MAVTPDTRDPLPMKLPTHFCHEEAARLRRIEKRMMQEYENRHKAISKPADAHHDFSAMLQPNSIRYTLTARPSAFKAHIKLSLCANQA